MSTSKRMANNLSRDLYVLEDESNPKGTQVDRVWATTILDNVFDNLSPTNKTLRQIIEELRQEIITGGRGNIVFPVTSVNGMSGDIVITKEKVGLGRVDNTPDVDKPLSTPQRTAVEEMLKNFNFHVNLDDLYDHLVNTSNPHGVTIEQLNEGDALAAFVKRHIANHNFSKDHSVHMDIRNSLSRLWTMTEGINGTVEEKLGRMMALLEAHTGDTAAHQDLFDAKEDVKNKAASFSLEENGDNIHYPTTRAVINYTSEQLGAFRRQLPDISNWIDDIQVVSTRDDLPGPSLRYLHKAYFIRKGRQSFEEVGVCRQNPNGSCYWDISALGAYSKFNPDHFVDSASGLSINMSSVIDAIISENGMLDTSLSNILADYYKKEDIDGYKFINSIHVSPGTIDGTIRFYVNEDLSTMSDDIKVAGLKRLAFLERITENELADQAVFSRHIISRAIESRHLNPKIITLEHMTGCGYGKIIGNMTDADGVNVEDISLTRLADILRPLIGGWPDPSTPGGNPWNEIIDNSILHQHKMSPGVEHPISDGTVAIRFTGAISSPPNVDNKTVLSTTYTCDKYRIIDGGGSWEYQSSPSEWSILGGSNITGHTFATIVMTENGLQLGSISIGSRYNAKYDIWVKLAKIEDLRTE